MCSTGGHRKNMSDPKLHRGFGPNRGKVRNAFISVKVKTVNQHDIRNGLLTADAVSLQNRLYEMFCAYFNEGLSKKMYVQKDLA